MSAGTRRRSAPTGRPPADTDQSALVTAQATGLEAEEATIRRSLGEAAAALTRIRDGKLYRQGGFDSFDAYCTERLGFGRGRADQIIGAGRTIAALPTNVGSALNEAQARALSPIADDPAQMEQVIEAATVDGKLTAAAIAAEIDKRDARRLTDEIDAGLTDLRKLTANLTAWGAGHLADEIDRLTAELFADPDRRDELHEELEHVLAGHDDNVTEAKKMMDGRTISFAAAYRAAAITQRSHTAKFMHTVTLARQAITRLRTEGRHADADRLTEGILADIAQPTGSDGTNIPPDLTAELFVKAVVA